MRVCFDTERVGNARLSNLVIGDISFTAISAETGKMLKNAALSLCDLPGLRVFVVGNSSLFPIDHMKLMSCHGICYSPVDICESVSCRFGNRSMYALSLESSSSLFW